MTKLPTHKWQRDIGHRLGSNDESIVLEPCVFIEPPVDAEIDKEIAKQPWVLRTRITKEAYAERCRQAGRKPHEGEWSAHLRLDDDEIELLTDFEDQINRWHNDAAFGKYFRIRDYGNRPRPPARSR